jgi:dTDP-4-dehydrorhamnose reductase
MNITVIGAGSTTAMSLVPMLLEETDARLHLISSKAMTVEDERVAVDVVDITDRKALKDVMMRNLPQTIVNTAAMTNVDACETERQLAWSVNVTVVEHLTRIARAADAHLIHLSTDYVFDGEDGPYDELATPAPINYYGKTKLAGENVLASSGIDHTIVRTNVLYGPNSSRQDFVNWVSTNMEQRSSIKVVNDQYCNPTYVDDLSEAIIRIAERRRTGLYHIGGADYLSRFELAQQVALFYGVSPNLVKPIETEELQQTARRPLMAGLVTLKAESDLRMRFRGISSGLVTIRHAMLSESLSRRPS